VPSGALVLADPKQSGSQIRKTRKCAGQTKRKTKGKIYRSENKTLLTKDIITSKDTKCLDSFENEQEEACSEFSVNKFSDDFNLTEPCDQCDQCDVCYACQRKLNRHKIFSNAADNSSPDTFDRKCMLANDTLDVAWRPDAFGLSGESNFALASNLEREDNFDKNIRDDGKVVCTLVVPQITGWAGFYDQLNLTTSDSASDKDSGVFSEEHSPSAESAVQPCVDCHKECNTTDDETKYKHHSKSEREVRGIFDEDKSDRGNECPLAFENSSSRCPFERRVWKRKNGWYKVRNPMCPRPLDKTTINYADHEAELGSERSEQPGPDFQENFKFFRDTEAAKEFNPVREGEKITLNQEPSDRDQQTPETSERPDTIKVTDQQTYRGYLSDFQVKLEQMKLEIAEMVAEAAELDNTSGESDDEIDDDISLHNEHWNMEPDNLDYSETESNNSETEDEDASFDILSDYGEEDDYIKYHTL